MDTQYTRHRQIMIAVVTSFLFMEDDNEQLYVLISNILKRTYIYISDNSTMRSEYLRHFAENTRDFHQRIFGNVSVTFKYC